MTHAPPAPGGYGCPPVISPDRRPHLAMVSSNGPKGVGGLASYVRHLAAELDDTFVTLHVSRFRGSGPTELTYTAREAPSRTSLDGRAATTIAPPTATLPLLRLARRLVYYPALQPAARRLFDAGFRHPLASAVSRDVDVVHSVGTGWEMLGFSALALARRRGAKLTVWPAMHPGVWGDSVLDARLYREADAVFAQSRYERDRLVELGVRVDRIVVTGLAPAAASSGDGVRFRTRHGLGDRPLVLFLGRKHRYKGYHALREAMAMVLAEQPTTCLVSLGPPGEPPYPPLPPGAELDLGLVDEAEKADALAACDVFCMPSAEEAFGIVYTEAWAYGKPVVGGPAPAVRELIREDVDGYATTQDCADIAAALVRLLGDRSLRERLGAAGRKRQLAEFTWPVVAERHRATFMAALGRS
jgi:glycosyltransferase involved in cell wall biosynthesis